VNSTHSQRPQQWGGIPREKRLDRKGAWETKRIGQEPVFKSNTVLGRERRTDLGLGRRTEKDEGEACFRGRDSTADRPILAEDKEVVI